jgi:hypothetical protein
MQNASAHGDTRKYTFLFQTGAWDLMMASLRRSTRDPLAYPRLLKIFESIFSGSLPCGGLTHLVWLTPLPHPICFDDANTMCQSDRSFRNNPAVEALNQHLMSNVLRMSQIKNTRIRLSVIDAFSIVRPRLIFNEHGEIACLNHFTCRVTNKIDNSTQIVQSPGGTAVVKSILNVLSFEYNLL